jgi:hypothetical protein
VTSRFKPRHLLTLTCLLLASGCATDFASGQSPNYPPGYDTGQGSGEYYQPGDMFGGQDVASIDAFLQPLSEYGRWVDTKYGRAFQPDAGQDYRPYVNGHWGEDRLWISDDPWGWATDHYGRWGFDEDYGWVWVPGTQWAPSWVAWRDDTDQDVVGWAPIPPGVNYSIGVGFGSGFYYDDFNSWYAPSWVWVPRANIYQRGFGGRVLPWNSGRNYWRGSQWNYNSGWNGRPGYNRPGGWAPRAGNAYRPGGNRPDNIYRPGAGQDRGNNQAGRPGYRQPDNRQPGISGGYFNRNDNRQRPDSNGRPGNTAQPYLQGQRNPGYAQPPGGNQPGYFQRGNRNDNNANRTLPQVYNGVNPAGQPYTPPVVRPGNLPAQTYGGDRNNGNLGREPNREQNRSPYNGGNRGGNAVAPAATYQRPPQAVIMQRPTPQPQVQQPRPPQPQAQPQQQPGRRENSGTRRNNPGDRDNTRPN